MADSIKFEVTNLKGFQEAMKLAPKVVSAAIKKQFKLEGSALQVEFRKSHLFGAPGINLPKRFVLRGKKGQVLKSKKRKDGDARKIQLGHVVTKVVVGKNGVVLVGYLSRFLGFHAAKLEQPFKTAFQRLVPKLNVRLEKEVTRITQEVLDKGLRTFKRG